MREILILIVFLSCFIFSCTNSGKKDFGKRQSVELDHRDQMKLIQYISQGRILYKEKCSNCHQANGEGLASLYPPVKNSDYLMKDVSGAICYVKNGLKGEITVNGVPFSQAMPANEALTDLELAEIMTFVVNELNDSTALISAKEVHRILNQCLQK